MASGEKDGRQPLAIVADDDGEISTMVTRYLEHKGMRVLSFSSALGVKEAVRVNRPDICILDISMPGLTGGMLARLLRTDPGNDKTPIIFFSALDPAQASRHSENIPSACYVPKTAGLEALWEQVQRMLAGS